MNTRAARLLSRNPWLLTLLLGGGALLLGARGPDLPAQEFRTWVVKTSGPVSWSNLWYGGHPLPGYSVIFPNIAALLGVRVTGLIAATACTWLAVRLLPQRDGAAARTFGFAASAVLVGDLIIGQLPFLLGLAWALGALLAIQRNRPVLAAFLAAACALSSPLTGFFLLLGALALAASWGWRRVLPLAAGGSGLLVSAITGGGSGRYPFPLTSLIGVVGFTVVAVAISHPKQSALRRFALAYGLVGIALFVIPNPIGGNLARLGTTVALPLAGYVLLRQRRPFVLALVSIPILILQLGPVTTAVARAAGDPSSDARYYSGLLSFLSTQQATDGRLEIPITREHWETSLVAPSFPIARGWERQLDVRYNEVLYQPLNAAAYRRWLTSNAVTLVALPDVPLDSGGIAERSLLAARPTGLTEVWHDAHWRVWRVISPVPLASGPARMSGIGVDSFTLDFPYAGVQTVRLRASWLWRVTDGEACIKPTNDGWLAVTAHHLGSVTLRASLVARGKTIDGCD